jgi:hypothetical protein
MQRTLCDLLAQQSLFHYVPFMISQGDTKHEATQVCGVVVGKGFRFGYKAAGDTEALLSLGAKYNLDVSVVDLVERDAMHGSEKVVPVPSCRLMFPLSSLSLSPSPLFQSVP